MKTPTLPKKILVLESLLSACAQRYRIAILMYLKQHEYASVGALSEHVGISFHNTSKHLRILEQENLIHFNHDGNYRLYSLNRNLHPVIHYMLQKI